MSENLPATEVVKPSRTPASNRLWALVGVLIANVPVILAMVLAVWWAPLPKLSFTMTLIVVAGTVLNFFRYRRIVDLFSKQNTPQAMAAAVFISRAFLAVMLLLAAFGSYIAVMSLS